MPHNISVHVALIIIYVCPCVFLYLMQTHNVELLGIKIGAISRTSPSSHPPTICVGPWGKFVHVSNVYVRMHVEVQALHYTWNGMYRVDLTSACCQEGLPWPTCHSE